MSQITASAMVPPDKWPASRRLRWLAVGLVLVALASGAAAFAVGNGDSPWVFWFLLLQAAAILMLGALALRMPWSSFWGAAGTGDKDEQLRLARQQLIDGIEGLTDGFALYDADDRLVVCNEKYWILTGSEPDVVKPGTRFEDILHAHVKAGHEPSAVGREEEWIARRLAQHRDAQGTYERFVDGHWYRFSDRPTSDGGIVTIFAQIDELKQREQRLRESQAILQSILDNIPVTVSITDRERRIVLLNREIEELYGVKLQDVIGRRVTEVRPQRFGVDTAEEDHHAVVRTGQAINSREDHYVSELGEETWISSVVPIKDDEGQVKFVLRTTIEVPQLARANRELGDHRAFLIEAERQARIASWYQSAEMDERIFWSENVEAVIGYTPDQIANDSAFLAVVHPADRERIESLFKEVGERPRSYEGEYRIVRPDGSAVWIRSITKVELDPHGHFTRYIGTIQDVTAQKSAEEALRESQEFLLTAERRAKIACWTQTIGEIGGFVDRDLAAYVLGITTAEMPKNDPEYVQMIHPEDRERAVAAYCKADQDHLPYSVEYRLVRRDGSIAWIRDLAEFQTDSDGKPSRMIGTIQDITDQKRIEEALRDSEARLRAFIENSPVGISIKDPNQRFVLLNRVVEESFGLTAAEIIGRRSADILKSTGGQGIDAIEREVVASGRTVSRDVYAPEKKKSQWTHEVKFPILRADGSLDAIGGVAIDISGRRRAELAHAESEARLRAFLDHAPAIMYLKDREGHYQVVNREFERAEGVTAEEVRGRTLSDLKPRRSRPALAEQDREVLETGRVSVREISDSWAGEFKHMIVVKFPARDASGNIVGIGCFAQDITERKRAEEALRASEARMKAFVDNAPIFISIKGRDRRFMMINRKVSVALGVPPEQIIGKTISEVLPGPGAASIMDMEQEVFDTGRTVSREVFVPERLAAPWTLEVKFPITDADGEIFAVGGVAIDISARKKAELALAESEARFDSFMDHAPFDMYVKDLNGRYLMVNGGAEISWCRPKSEILGKTVREMSASGGVQEVEDIEREVLATGHAVVREVHFTDLGPEWTHEVKFPIKDGAGNITHIGGVAVDISNRKKIELALAESERRLRRAQQQARLAYWSTDLAISAIEWSPGSGVIFGVDDSAMPVTEAAYSEFIHPDDRERIGNLYAELRNDLKNYSAEYRLVRPDGTTVWVRELGEVEFDASGHRIAAHGTLQDITERRTLEEQLQQSQKMEAIGQLTGGIAHDFNNLLAIILGNLDLLNEQKDMAFSARRKIETSIKAGLRAADLTHRLLAFARRQALMPKPTDINELIRSMAPLLQRPLGPKIAMTFNLAPDIWAAEVDTSQLEMALLNLTLNARDAMQDGGSLTITTGNAAIPADQAAGVPAGEYVSICVADTGTGMSDDVKSRAFDPFFTTKGVGKGTGLGLSMVYGFVKQSGGHVHLESREGEGTSVIIHLAKSSGPVRREDEDEPIELSAGRQETILLVEDEADVRSLAETHLEAFGYSVISAFDGPTALAAVDANAKIDLLLTDIILPGQMDGIAIAAHVRAKRPDIKIVYISGYAPDPDQLLPDTALIRKPFLKADLSRVIREALDGKASGAVRS
jgi:PAS domain S-box-containing protein